MIELILKIVVKIEIPIKLSLEEIRAFPTHKSFYYQFYEKIIILEYKPTKYFDHEGFEKMIKNKIKKQYKAHSIEVLNREHKEIKP